MRTFGYSKFEDFIATWANPNLTPEDYEEVDGFSLDPTPEETEKNWHKMTEIIEKCSNLSEIRLSELEFSCSADTTATDSTAPFYERVSNLKINFEGAVRDDQPLRFLLEYFPNIKRLDLKTMGKRDLRSLPQSLSKTSEVTCSTYDVLNLEDLLKKFPRMEKLTATAEGYRYRRRETNDLLTHVTVMGPRFGTANCTPEVLEHFIVDCKKVVFFDWRDLTFHSEDSNPIIDLSDRTFDSIVAFNNRFSDEKKCEVIVLQEGESVDSGKDMHGALSIRCKKVHITKTIPIIQARSL